MSYPHYFKYQAFENARSLKWTLQSPPRCSSQGRPVAGVVGEEEAKGRKGSCGTAGGGMRPGMRLLNYM